MKEIKYNITKVFALFLLVSSCNDILDETPDNRTAIDSAEKIAELLVAAYPEAGYVSFLEPMSDNAIDKGTSATTEFRVNEEMFFWRDLNDIDEDTPTNYWNKAYEAIAQANQALLSIKDLGDGSELKALKGEALMCRAYGHFMLVNMFSKAYNPTTANSDVGIPYITKPENVLLGSYDRGTVANVYENIEKDIEAGLPLVTDNYDIPVFHFTKKAAHAFASKFYLNIAEWEKVITHSTVALGGGSDSSVLRDIASSSNLTFNEQVAQYTSSTFEPANLLLVAGNSLYNRIEGVARYQLATSLADQIFGGNPTGKNWSYSRYSRGGSGNSLVPKYDEYFRVTNQAAGIGIPFVTFVLLSTDEALLNRAEAYAMLGDLDRATEDINLSLSVKTDNYNASTDALTKDQLAMFYGGVAPEVYTPFYAIPAESLPFINGILDIKRTVFYNEGMRWFDIKRHDMVVEHFDIFGNSIMLPKGDNRRAIQIPESARSFGIEENIR